ncbi:MAG TPA: hypothetical protein VFW50_39860 [Streptosporangiaceae bacterium]|nr:hypothetical protein [Streptosporangiaceae bacterium]
MQIRGTWSAGPGDDQARFLADLRALRDSVAIGYDELSARAHYPSNVLKEAENGPSLPGLPILSAYVRACEGDVLDWEERWRRLNPEVPDDPDLPVRPAGASAAAVAGARAGVGVAPPDVYDPDRIRAALRGDPGRSEQSSRKDNDPGILAPAPADAEPGYDQPAKADTNLDSGSSWGAGTGWDTPAEPHVTSANGNHAGAQAARGPFDAAFPSTPDTAGDSRADEFTWLTENPPQSAPGENEPASWSASAESEPSPWEAPAESEPTSWSARADSGLASQPKTGAAAREPDITERIPRYQAESLTAPDRTDFWAKSSPAPSAPADLRPPSVPRAEEPTVTRASWASAGMPSSPASPAMESAQRIPATAGTAAGSGTAQSAPSTSLLAAGSQSSGPQAHSQPAASSQNPVGQPAHAGRPDRYFPVRLLVVIVIAALIGSALVLLLK